MDIKPGIAQSYKMVFYDDTGPYNRHYNIQLPSNYNGLTKTPLMFYFHGWAEAWPCEPRDASMGQCHFHEVGDKNGYITVLPLGMADGYENFSSWNVFSNGRDDVCTEEVANEGFPMVYTSCETLNDIGPCNWHTCHDDVQFVVDLLDYLSDRLCIDEENLFATGSSNGGMFLYSLLPAMADRGLLRHRFKAIFPLYAAGFQNMESIQHAVPGIAVFHHHGLYDLEVPAEGGASQDFFLYRPVCETLRDYALGNGCSEMLEAITTPWDNINGSLIGCHRYQGCTGPPVMRCDYDAGHNFWYDFTEEFIWWQIKNLLPHPVVTITDVIHS